ncbi:jg24064, partial [Pararge aegeria aegeria]
MLGLVLLLQREHEFIDIDDEVEDPTFEPETQNFDEDVISYEENPEPNVEARQEPATIVERHISSDEVTRALY